jgi:hypothetical protein
MPAGRTGPAPASRSVSWLVKAPMADRFVIVTSDISGIWQARCQGTRASAAMTLYGASLLARGPRLGRGLRLAGLAAVSASGLAGGHISFRLAGGANHAEPVPHARAATAG